MMSLVITVHVVVCIVLIALILVQRGRGGGFIESFSGLESMLGTKTSAFLSRLTSILAVIFFFTCLGLAFLSLKESRSLMRGVKPKALPAAKTVPANATAGNSSDSIQVQKQEIPARPASVATAPGAPANQTGK